jgi:hypothetical protein
MSLLIGAFMVVAGVVGIIVAVTGTQGNVWQAVTGHSAAGTLLVPATTTASTSTPSTPAQLMASLSGGSTTGLA